MENLFNEIIQSIGEDPGREGLKDTPRRASDALRFFNQWLPPGFDSYH